MLAFEKMKPIVNPSAEETEKKRKPNYSLRLLLILLAGFAFVIAGTIAEENFDPHNPQLASLATVAHVLKELGFAGIIGVIIAYAIDLVSTKEFIETVDNKIVSIQRNVFRSTFGREMTDELIAEVEKLILEANFIRRGHRITYQLSVLRAQDLNPNDKTLPDINIVNTEVSLWYDVENISTLEKPYSLRIEVEKPPYKELGHFVQINTLVVNGKEYSFEEIKRLTTETDGTKSLVLPHSILPGKGKGIRVSSSWRTIKLLTDVELWRSFLPSDGMTLCVTFPKGTIAKGAMALHRKPVTPRFEKADYCEWAIEGAVLPQQGIVFYWRCEPPDTTPQVIAS